MILPAVLSFVALGLSVAAVIMARAQAREAEERAARVRRIVARWRAEAGRGPVVLFRQSQGQIAEAMVDPWAGMVDFDDPRSGS